MSLKIDQLLMLLSSDWFFGAADLFGLSSNAGELEHMRDECRVIVEELLNGEDDYFLVSFDPDRVDRTFTSFNTALSLSGLTGADKSFFLSIITEDRDDLIVVLGVFGSLISVGTPDSLPSYLKDALSKFASNESAEASAVELWMNSATKWDRYLRGLTPGLPEWLGDFAVEEMLEIGKFRRIWSCLIDEISCSEILLVKQWFGDSANEIANRPVLLPDFI